MSHEDRIRQIQNGLKIIDLVDEIRSNNQQKPTYGRSAISLPTTRERTNAWELFHQVATDANGYEKGPDKKRDDNTEERDERGSEHDDNDISGRGERTFKESTWDDSDNIIFENSLATNIQQNDSRRESSNRITDNKNDDSKRDNTSRGGQSNGRAEDDQINLPSILKGGLSADRDASRFGESTKSVMNPNAKEYIPKYVYDQWSRGGNQDSPESKAPVTGIQLENKVGPEIPPAKPGMQKKIKDSDKYPEFQGINSPPPIPKKRGCVLLIPDTNIEPIESEGSEEEEEDEDQIVPTGNTEKNSEFRNSAALSSSQETIFQISDYETDNERRNKMGSRLPKEIEKEVIKEGQKGNGKKEEVTKKAGNSSDKEKKPKKEGRKLRALQNTDAGTAGPNSSNVSEEGSIKKGHRREYSLSWDGSEIQVEEWCNPSCSRIRSEAIREDCTCFQCPPECSQEGCTGIRYATRQS
ncbi:V protein [melian virus]|uniref:Non-structural protein V n=1 Tax=melian virus TaxID=2940995 RepID=A0AAE9HQ88_9MONO|nr:V protein [melian virus]